MNCKYLRVRSIQKKKHLYCILNKKTINYTLECSKCLKKEYKKNKALKKQTNKQKKLEANRYSLLTNDLEHCYICTEQGIENIPKDDLHEIYGGCNRKRSMINGFVVPLCRKHHKDDIILAYLRRLMQIEFEETHTREEFIEIVGKSFLKDL